MRLIKACQASSHDVRQGAIAATCCETAVKQESWHQARSHGCNTCEAAVKQVVFEATCCETTYV